MANNNIKHTKQKKKHNKVVFYGLPIVAVIVVFTGLVTTILPAVNYYLESRKKNVVLDKNDKVVNKSIENLNKTKSYETYFQTYQASFEELIPKNPKVGDIIHLIEEKADDFNLEHKLVTDNDASKTSIKNLSGANINDKELLESINSGEVAFVPKDSTSDVTAILVSIELGIEGNKQNFHDFIEAMKGFKPLINLSYVSYKESGGDVTSSVRFESYALKYNKTIEEEAEHVSKLKDDDTSIFNEMTVEEFKFDKEGIEQKLGVINSANPSVTPTPAQ